MKKDKLKQLQSLLGEMMDEVALKPVSAPENSESKPFERMKFRREIRDKFYQQVLGVTSPGQLDSDTRLEVKIALQEAVLNMEQMLYDDYLEENGQDYPGSFQLVTDLPNIENWFKQHQAQI